MRHSPTCSAKLWGTRKATLGKLCFSEFVFYINHNYYIGDDVRSLFIHARLSLTSCMSWKRLGCIGYSETNLFVRILISRRQPDTAIGTCVRKKMSFCRILTRRRQPDTAAPGFEVATAPCMQYKGQTPKNTVFQKLFPWSPIA